MKSENYFKSLVKGFVAGIFILAAMITVIFNIAGDKYAGDSALSRLGKKFPLAYTDTQIEAKHRHIFTTVRADYRQNPIAFDYEKNPQTLKHIFPGYPEAMYADRELFNKYFTREFNPASWIHEFSQTAGVGIQVVYSWTGCFDIFKKYGADILVIGNSEAYFGVEPDLLFELLNKSGIPNLRNQRVLMCPTGFMLFDMVRTTANQLQTSNKAKLKWVVWGSSFWTSHLKSSEFEGYRKDRDAAYNGYLEALKEESRQQTLKDRILNFIQDYRLSSIAPDFGWSKIFYPRFVKFKEALKIKNKTLSITEPEEGGLIKLSNLNDKNDLEKKIEEIKPFYHPLKLAKTSDCDLTDASTEMDKTIEALKNISDKVFIYITPATPHLMRAGPDCLLPAVVKMYKTKVSNDVVIQTSDWKHYGLDHSDYIFNTENPDIIRFDENHTNWKGAEKVTEQLAKELISAEEKQK